MVLPEPHQRSYEVFAHRTQRQTNGEEHATGEEAWEEASTGKLQYQSQPDNKGDRVDGKQNLACPSSMMHQPARYLVYGVQATNIHGYRLPTHRLFGCITRLAHTHSLPVGAPHAQHHIEIATCQPTGQPLSPSAVIRVPAVSRPWAGSLVCLRQEARPGPGG